MTSPDCAPATGADAAAQLCDGMLGGSNVTVVDTAAMSAFRRPAAVAASTTFALPTASAPIVGFGYVPARPPAAGPLGAALTAVVAEGTVARVVSLMSPPINELSATLGDVMAFAFTFTPVTAFFFSCFVPTLFLGSA
jgi:hypothetical protein